MSFEGRGRRKTSRSGVIYSRLEGVSNLTDPEVTLAKDWVEIAQDLLVAGHSTCF
jgi:hypothetical protein